MKLGTETGSFVNHIQSRMTKGQPDAVAGMGVTLLHWTDRSAGTIFRVFKSGVKTIIEVRADDATRIDRNGMSECQDYTFKTNVNGAKSYFAITEKDGAWFGVKQNEKGRWVKSRSCGLHIGSRSCYHDFSF